MARTPNPAGQLVWLVQALTARELVEQLGIPVRRAGRLLGIAPSAVSQYVHGRRREGALAPLALRPDVRAAVHRVARALAEHPSDGTASARLLLEAAAELAPLVGGSDPSRAEAVRAERIDRATLAQLRERVAAEQAAVANCMQLAQKARDELTRAIFRQIASDSLRHAEIVASLAVYLESGLRRSRASGIERADVEELIRREKDAESQSSERLHRRFGGVMGLLAESMAADERKHERMLEGLLAEGFPD
jgi:uncharacterized protein